MKKKKAYLEEYVSIRGTEHYLLHYRSKAEDPVLLFLHGGPGQSETMLAYRVEEYQERKYNIVYYDQRGAGKTYLKNKKDKPDTETLKNDLLEIVQYLKKLYRKEKIGILGHSWGSVLGSMFALEHPEHTLCYIGCGQLINTQENERIGYAKLKEAITMSKNKKDYARLQNLGEYPLDYFDKDVFWKMGRMRSLQGKYDLGLRIDGKMVSLFLKSPIIGWKDILPFLTGMMVSSRVMDELMRFDLRQMGCTYDVPVYYVLGEKDQQTPVEIGIAYFNEIKAPVKKLYVVKDAGHVSMIDNTAEYRKAICKIVSDCRQTRNL